MYIIFHFPKIHLWFLSTYLHQAAEQEEAEAGADTVLCVLREWVEVSARLGDLPEAQGLFHGENSTRFERSDAAPKSFTFIV